MLLYWECVSFRLPARWKTFRLVRPHHRRNHTLWPAPGSEDTELGVILEPEVVYGTQTLCTRVQA